MSIDNKKNSLLSHEKKKLMLLIVFAILALLITGIFPKIIVPQTHSVTPRLLWKTGIPGNALGDYILFEKQDTYLPNNQAYLVKKIGCLAGQRLSRIGRQFFCDKKELGSAFLSDSNGVALRQFYYDGLIPPGLAFAIGDSSGSYDSRYWGFIALDKTEKLTPVF